MAIKFGNSIDLNGYQIMNFRVHVSNAAPSSPDGGSMWFDDINNILKYHNGTTWVSPVTAPSVITSTNIPQWNGTSGLLSNGLSLQTTIRIAGVATDTALVTEKAIRDALDIIIGGGGGVTDHGALSGLADDDHTQYYNQTRGDARYALVGHNHSGVYSLIDHTHTGIYEPILGNPSVNGYVLSSTTGGVRSWVAQSGGTTDHSLLTNLQGGTSGEYYHLTEDLYNTFEYVPNSGDPYLRVKLPIACDYEVQAYTDFSQFPPTIWESMPLATTTSIGGIIYTAAGTRFLREDGTWQTVTSGSSMVYPAGSGIPIVVSGTSWGTTIVNNSTNWNTAYSWGNHAGLYSLVSHNHSGTYEPFITKSTGYLRYTGSAWEFRNETYSLSSHNHAHNDLTSLQGGTTGEYYHLIANIYNALEYVPNSGDPYLRVKLPIACDYEIQAYTDFSQFPPTIWESMPLATSTAIGGIQLGSSNVLFLREDGTWAAPPSGSGMVYPSGSGIPIVSSGMSWGTTISPSTGYLRYTGSAWEWKNETYSLSSHTHSGVYEPALGNPSVTGYVLSSTTAGVRSWVAMTAGVTDHGALTGLGDDDHTQYYNQTRGDARYSLLAHSHGSIASAGTISVAAITPASGDYIVLTDASNSHLVSRGPVLGSSTTTYLRNDGTWGTPAGTLPVDSTLLDWSTDRYQPYAAAATGAFDTSATTPTGTTRMNYGGYFYATQLYDGGTRVSTMGHTHAESAITFTDITTNNATTSLHGYLPKLGGGSTNFLRADGTWAAPPGTLTGSGTNTYLAYWSGASALTGSSSLTFDGSTLSIGQGIHLNTPSTNQTASGIKTTLTAGEALAFGNMVYMKNDGKVWKAAASGVTTTPVIGMCLNTVSANGSAIILLSGRAYNTSWSLGTGGDEIYLTTSAGGFSISAPSGVTGYVIQVLGVVLSATTIYFNPSLNQTVLA